jgi:3-methyladenine DNA glycosylase AlkC
LCAALEACLPEDFSRAAAILEASLGPAGMGDDLKQLRTTPQGLAGWPIWPMGEFVARRGLDDPERALRCLHALTQRFSAEFAIRPLLLHHPKLCFSTLKRWTTDPSAHVRRLVSEGSRPRLPWGKRLDFLVLDPSPTLPLLERLQDDPSAYVRRSVANHWNDIAKDHPALVAAWIERSLPTASKQTQTLLRHAARTLIKRGDARTLRAFGLGAPLRGECAFSIKPARITVGEHVELQLELRSRSKRAQKLAIDFAVHHVKHDRSTTAKVFKGWLFELAPGESRSLRKRHSLRAVTTRRYYAGRHAVELRINGRSAAKSSFDLRLAKP